MTPKFVHAPTVCTMLFFPLPPQEPGNEATDYTARITVMITFDGKT